MTVNVAAFVKTTARDWPQKLAVTSMGREMTYEEVDRASNSIARGLMDAGIRKGDAVALSAPNILEFVTAYFGILKAGGIVVPFNVMNKRAEISHILSDSGARGLICFEGSPELPLIEEASAAMEEAANCKMGWMIPTGVRPQPPGSFQSFAQLMKNDATDLALPQTEYSDVAVVLYTSGTTGRPKGVELTHANLVFTAMICGRQVKLTEKDRVMLPLPLFHVMGQCVMMLSCFFTASTIDLIPRFDPKACLEQMARVGSTFFAGVPTMYSALVMVGKAMPDEHVARIRGNLRICLSGAAPLPEDLLHQFEEMFDTEVREGYGLTETTSIISLSSFDYKRKVSSVGRPAFGTEIRLIDEDGKDVGTGNKGELICRGPTVMRGYRGRPEDTAATFIDGWFRTGDIAIQDDEGYVFVVDRKKDVIIRGGYNVYPAEVENVLTDHEGVAMAAVIGRPDPHLGEEVIAFVSLAHGSEVSGEELVEWCKTRLANYKYPRLVVIRPALPLNGTGKILKTILRAELQPA
jgi:long-chain acyl-CoA synthetase